MPWPTIHLPNNPITRYWHQYECEDESKYHNQSEPLRWGWIWRMLLHKLNKNIWQQHLHQLINLTIINYIYKIKTHTTYYLCMHIKFVFVSIYLYIPKRKRDTPTILGSHCSPDLLATPCTPMPRDPTRKVPNILLIVVGCMWAVTASVALKL